MELGSSVCTVGAMDGLDAVTIVGSDDGRCEVSANELGRGDGTGVERGTTDGKVDVVGLGRLIKVDSSRSR